ncbi:MAG: LTA synthase family protein, partial [Sarcina sp.]
MGKRKELLDKILQKIVGNKYLVFLILTAILFIKGVLFLIIMRGENSATINVYAIYQSLWYTIPQIAFAMIVSSFVLLFKEKGRLIYALIIDSFFSALIIFELMYFRVYGNFLSIRMILYPQLFNPLNKQIFDFQKVDMVFIYNLIILLAIIIYYFIVHKNNNQKRNFIAFIISFLLPIAVVCGEHYLLDIKDITDGDYHLYFRSFAPEYTVRPLGPIGYHIYDISTFSTMEEKLTKEQKQEVDKWMEDNYENIVDNKYKGILKDKNIIVIQWESLEEFVIGAKTNGQEITPNMNKLLSHSLFFDNIYEQNREGTTSDGEFMANTGLLPLRKESVFLNYPWRYTNSLPRILEKEGYTTITSHGEVGGNWNWAEAHTGLGMNELWDLYSYDYSDKMYMGLYDKSYLAQLDDRVDNELKKKQPFYLFATTLTSHGPFDLLPKEDRELNLPKDVDDTYLGGYFQSVHYTDKHLGIFIDELRKKGILKNTALVIYGDHAGVNKYYSSQLEGLNYENRWWAQNDLKVPLIIYDESIPGEVISTNGGLSDLTPTLAYLMGINRDEFKYTSVGRVLVNTDRNTTLKSNGTIVGKVKDKSEEEHLNETFKINEILLRTDYI